MLHGRLKAKEKNDIMSKFKNKEIDILVSTSVIEVGIDIPNATIIMIEGSERFGLAQLYQFRGRVGRGEHQSYCLLLTDAYSKTIYSRLNSIVEAKNGYELAEKDLQLRGPGQFLGEEQAGMPDIAMKALKNPSLVKNAKEEADKILSEDPKLKKHPHLSDYLSNFRRQIHLE
jgi:ATP-dependent DNA helicase RecG